MMKSTKAADDENVWRAGRVAQLEVASTPMPIAEAIAKTGRHVHEHES